DPPRGRGALLLTEVARRLDLAGARARQLVERRVLAEGPPPAALEVVAHPVPGRAGHVEHVPELPGAGIHVIDGEAVERDPVAVARALRPEIAVVVEPAVAAEHPAVVLDAR